LTTVIGPMMVLLRKLTKVNSLDNSQVAVMLIKTKYSVT
jgi:hypothetical protein